MWPIALALLGPFQDVAPDPSIPADPLGADVASEQRARFARGLGEAEGLRRELLGRDLGGRSRADRLGEAIARFCEGAAGLLSGRPGVDAFALGPDEFEARIRGMGREDVDAERSFGPFAWRWYGLWDGRRVDHDWSEGVVHDPPRSVPGIEGPLVRATQSAWIGDGFGWNVVARPDEGGAVILGTVYHVEPGRPERVRRHRPHVAVALGPGRLIWITVSEVFPEEVLVAADTPGTTRYAMSGPGCMNKRGWSMPRRSDPSIATACHSMTGASRCSRSACQTLDRVPGHPAALGGRCGGQLPPGHRQWCRNRCTERGKWTEDV